LFIDVEVGKFLVASHTAYSCCAWWFDESMES
jgi:hypothetical protein